MRPLIIIGKCLHTLPLLSLSLLLTITACKNNDTPVAENSSPSQKEEQITSTKDSSSLPPEVVVEVNGVKLTESEIKVKTNKAFESIKSQLPQDQMEQMRLNIRKTFIENFIVRTLLVQEADTRKITASEAETNQAATEFEKRLPQGITLESVFTTGGISKEEFLKDITFSVRANKLFDAELTIPTPTDAEIKEYYTANQSQFDTPETVHARHILIKVSDKDDEKIKAEKMAKIEGIRKQLLGGADFEKLAREHSECPSKEKGGDLGTFSRGKMVKPFEDAAFNQKVNEIGSVVSTQFGYHLIKILEHNPAKTKTFDEVQDKVRELLTQQKKQEMVKNYLAQLKQKAKIVYRDAKDSSPQ